MQHFASLFLSCIFFVKQIRKYSNASNVFTSQTLPYFAPMPLGDEGGLRRSILEGVFHFSLGRNVKKCPKKKKNKKRADTDGFSHANMVEKLVNIKWYSANSAKYVVMTTLLQKFQCSSSSETVVQHICPWGIKDVIT